jgi:ferredoxin-NADP reductase
MEASIISALAALTGTAVGGLTSVAANWLTHRGQIRAQWLHHERSRRQILYRDFIDEASKCYIDALQHHEADADIPSLVGLYAKLGRMRVLSSRPVVHSAEHIAKKIMDTYLQPDKSFVELRDMANSGAIDLLREFSDACRDEFEQMRAQQF